MKIKFTEGFIRISSKNIEHDKTIGSKFLGEEEGSLSYAV
jgi:hypothetical protein